MIKSIIIGLLLFNIGCVYYPTNQSLQVKEVDSVDLDNCRLIGKVFGKSDYAFMAVGVNIAKDRAKHKANQLGATHIIWNKVTHEVQPYAEGRAYRCTTER